MAVIISESIFETEFGGSLSAHQRDVILRSAYAVLATPIKGENLPKGTRLLKAYATSQEGARRIVYLLEVEGGDLFLLFYKVSENR